MTELPALRNIASNSPPKDASGHGLTRRPAWLQALIVAGAFLSALAVLYASDVGPALGSAAVFFLFYRRLQPSAHVLGQEPAPEGPDEHEERRSAA